MNNQHTLAVDTFVKALKERSEQSGSGLDYAMRYLHSALLDLDLWGTQANRLKASTAILHELIDNHAAVAAKCNQDDSWQPACGGLEVPKLKPIPLTKEEIKHLFPAAYQQHYGAAHG